MSKRSFLVHLLDGEWEVHAEDQYRRAYVQLKDLFYRRVDEAFISARWIPDHAIREYLVRLLIRFVAARADVDALLSALHMQFIQIDDPLDRVRMHENAGEFVLWYSGLFRRKIYQPEGQKAYRDAYSQLRELEAEPEPLLWTPEKRKERESDRLRVDRLLSQHFEGYREVLEKMGLIEDPEYDRLRSLLFEPPSRN